MAGSASSLGSAIRQLECLFDAGTVSGLDDAQLLERFVGRRDEIAFAAIVERHGPMVLGVCRAVLKNATEVEDAFQATFLVLVRKAASIRGQNVLGGWLHRVAYRIAVQAGVEVDRRRMLERKAGELAARKYEINRLPDDLRAILHEEIDRLPERSRLPLVLCDLDGLDHAEASRRLGWSEGEFRGRLYRARTKLRDRLTRRGVGLSLVVLTEALAKESSAAVPRVWINAISKAAVAMPAGKIAATGAISATAAKLAQTTLATLFAAQAKGVATVGMLLVALGMVGVHTVPVGFAQAGNDGEMKKEIPAHRQSTKPIASKAEEDRTKPVAFAGVVLDPDDKPFAGAKVYLSRGAVDFRHKPTIPTFLGITGADGAFRLPEQVAEEGGHRMPSQVLALVPGYGPALADPAAKAGSNELKLVKDDVPIRGRILDLQGRPVSGSTVQVVGVLWSPSGKLDEWLEKLKVEKVAFPVQYQMLRMWANDDIPSLYPVVKTDTQGRFTITGIGRERIALLLIGGPGIETSFEFVATRPMPTIKMPDFARQNSSRQVTYRGAEFDLVGGPCLVATGTVTDKDTGKPLAGVTVETAALFGNPLRTLNTITDAQGRYRLSGIPPKTVFNDGQELLASTEDVPYVPAIKDLGQGDVKGPITIDFQLKRGVWAKGQVVEKSNGKGVRANLSYHILRDNPSLKEYPRYGKIRASSPFQTEEDGSFKLVVMPGPGVIGARAGNEHYRIGVGVDKIEGKNGSLKVFNVEIGSLVPNYHTVVGINPKEGDESIACTIELDRGKSVKGKVVGPDGKPLSGTRIEGLQDFYRFWSPLPTDEFLVEGIGQGASRDLLVYHEGKKLAGAYTIKPDEAGPIVVKLEPGGAVSGRLVDADGLPIAEAEMTCNVPFGDTSAEHGSLREPIKTGKDGRFRAEGLVPGRKYSFWLWKKEKKGISQPAGVQGIVVAPGEARDLGDIAVKPEKSQ